MMGKFAGKPYLMVKTMVSCKFPLNQPNDRGRNQLRPAAGHVFERATLVRGAPPLAGLGTRRRAGAEQGEKKRPRKEGNGGYINDGYINGYIYIYIYIWIYIYIYI